jgi:hypothetical protein
MNIQDAATRRPQGAPTLPSPQTIDVDGVNTVYHRAGTGV